MRGFNPKDINQPIQLLGASLFGAVLLVGEFIYASMGSPLPLMSWFYCITAILIFPIILGFIFILQTKYRDQILSDPFYYRTKLMDYKEQTRKMTDVNLKSIEKWLKQK